MTNTDKGVSLTSKQAAFAQMVADGVSLTTAYRECYNTNASDNVVRVDASKLAKNPKVAARIEQLRAGEPLVSADNQALSHHWIVERLREEAANKKNSAASRVRALELLGKHFQMFDESHTVVVKNRTPEEIEREIMARLTIILGGKSGDN